MQVDTRAKDVKKQDLTEIRILGGKHKKASKTGICKCYNAFDFNPESGEYLNISTFNVFYSF